MSAREIRAGGAFIEVYLKNKDRLDADLGQIQGKLNAFAGGIRTAGLALGAVSGAVIGGLTAAFMGFTSAADNLADAADRIGMSTTALQELAFAAGQTGASMGDVEAGVKRLEAIIGKAEKGEKSAIATLTKYGLSLEALKGMSPERQLDAIADAIARQPTQAQKAAAAMELMGKGGMALLPMLSQGAKGLAEFSEEANRLGLVRSEKDIALGGRLADMWGTIRAQVKAAADVIGAALGPSMLQAFTITQNLLAGLIHLADANRGVVVAVAVAAGVVGIASGALLALATAGFVASGAIAALTVVVSAAAAIWAALGATLAFIATPLGAIIALAIVAAGALAVFGVRAGIASGVVQAALMELWSVASQTFKGIFDAIMANDLGLAWSIALGGALVAWQQFQVKLTMAWEGLKIMLMNGISALVKHLIAQVEAAATAANTAANMAGVGVSPATLKNAFNLARTAANFSTAATKATAAENIRKELSELKTLQDGLNTLTDKAAKDALKMPDLNVPQVGPGAGIRFGGDQASVRGTFNAGAALQLGRGGDNIQNRQLEVLEDIEGHLEDIKEKEGAAFE